MTMTDPIADMLTRIRNANVAMHEEVRMPSSKLKEALAEVLRREGYIHGYDVAEVEARGTLTIDMKYRPIREESSAACAGCQGGLRVYTKADGVPRSSVSGGVLLDSAKDSGGSPAPIGGEILCYVW